MPKQPKTFIVRVTKDGVLFPPDFTASTLAMMRYRKKHPEAKDGKLQLTLEYSED